MAPALSARGRRPKSYSREASRGAHRAPSSGLVMSAGTAAYVMDTGQPWPASTCDQATNPAARRTCAPVPTGRVQGSAVRPWETAVDISSCQAGWNSTSSTRSPRGEWVCSTGVTRSAWSPQACARAVPASSPSRLSSTRSVASPHRVRPSVRAGSESTTLWPSSGGTWLVTSCVLTPGRLGRMVTDGYTSARLRGCQVRHAAGRRLPWCGEAQAEGAGQTRGAAARAMSPTDRVRRRLARVPGALALGRLVVATWRLCLRYRVTGLASEAGFFALLSLPPLVLGIFGGVGYVGRWLGPDTTGQVSTAIERYAERFLTDASVRQVIVPTVDDVLRNGRIDVISIGFVLSLWSGSRALNVFVDTISIMYGQSGVRGIVRTRALSFSLYLLALALGIVTIPLVLLGPSLLGEIMPTGWNWLIMLYWPLVTLLTVGGLTSLYHISTPRRSPWTRDVPGAVLTLVIWALASFFVRG